MARILIADDDNHVRHFFSQALRESGHDVLEAQDGVDALNIITSQSPELVLLDISMPELNGLEVLQTLRESLGTRALPVILMTTIPAEESEETGMNLGVNHYINKPCEINLLNSTVRVALREAETAAKTTMEASESYLRASDRLPQESLFRTGIEAVDSELSGGIRLGSLILIEGTAAAGKSVLCQHLIYGAGLAGHRTAYFGAYEDEKELANQMSSLGLETNQLAQGARLMAVPLREATPDEDPDHLLHLLGEEITRLPNHIDTIVVDSLTDLSLSCNEQALSHFFRTCKYRCRGGSSMMVTIHPSSVQDRLLVRLTTQADTYLRLSFKKMGFKTVHILEVLKLNNAENMTGKFVAFEVHGGSGIVPVPISQVTVGRTG